MTIARGAAVTAVEGSGSPTLSTAAYNQPAGEAIVVVAACEGPALMVPSNPSSVTDTAGNTYVARNAANDTSEMVQLFDCVAPCLGNASNVITVTWPVTPDITVLMPLRYTTSLGFTSFVDQPAGNVGATAAVSTAAFSAGKFAVGAVKNFGGAALSSAASGWSINTQDSGNDTASIDRIDNPGGTYAAGGTLATAANWAMVAASYTESATGPGGTLVTPNPGALAAAGTAAGVTPASNDVISPVSS